MIFFPLKKNSLLFMVIQIQLALLGEGMARSLWNLRVRMGAIGVNLFERARGLVSMKSKATVSAVPEGTPLGVFPGSTGRMEVPESEPVVREHLACLYHEIRNCTSTLKGNALLIKQNLSPEADVAPLLRIERVATAIEHIAREVMELADSAMMQPPEGISIDSLVKGCAEDYFSAFSEVFRFDFPETLPLLEGHPGKLRQAFVNLFRNSLEAGAGCIRVSARKSADFLYIEIEDDGEGCPSADLPMIFIPWHSTRKEKGGMGLGLFMVKKTIEEHGGTIRALGREVTGSRGMTMHMSFLLPTPPGPREDAVAKVLIEGI